MVIMWPIKEKLFELMSLLVVMGVWCVCVCVCVGGVSVYRLLEMTVLKRCRSKARKGRAKLGSRNRG